MRDFITKLFWKLRPFIKWVDHTFTIKSSIKKINGDHYYLWRDDINMGMVLLSNTNGAGSNIINPADINHAGIYYGRGLKSAIEMTANDLEEKLPSMSNIPKIKSTQLTIERLHETIKKYDVRDDICYVIEAVGSGTIPTNLVKFLTTKDKVKVLDPICLSEKNKYRAADLAILDFGKPYDFGFSDDAENRYCFEVVAKAYENADPSLKLNRHAYKLFGFYLYDSFLSDTFDEDPERFQCVINS